LTGQRRIAEASGEAPGLCEFHMEGSMQTENASENRYDPLDLNGRVAIVTGGGQGLGRHFVKAYARVGVISVIAELNDERANSVRQEIEALGGKALAVKADVTKTDDWKSVVDKTFEAFGRLDILVNNAAYFSRIKMRPFDQIPLEEWDLAMDVNVKGCFLGARAVVPAMREAGWGRIVNISSGVVKVAPPFYAHYPTSKAGLVGMTRALARELSNDGILVNALLPGAIETEVPRETVSDELKKRIISAQSIKRPQEPEDLVGPLLFFSSQACQFVTGQCMSVDGGSVFL
jgi:NAD(P)-dependent dehydrogenase (short-subunit alcohol dehydrogenase family)